MLPTYFSIHQTKFLEEEEERSSIDWEVSFFRDFDENAFIEIAALKGKVRQFCSQETSVDFKARLNVLGWFEINNDYSTN